MKKVLIYRMKFPRDTERSIQLEYFLRGAVAMSSENVDWSFGENIGDSGRFSIFCADDSFKVKLVVMFGVPDEEHDADTYRF